jgi:putative two-component system response regulator
MIVIADDLASTRSLLQQILAIDGYDVRAVPDGAAALELVEQDIPDLILTDVMMPRLNGIELCRRVKGNPATRLIPVVIITSLTAPEERIAGIEAGADDFLTKPFNQPELRARVRSLMRLRRYTNDLDSAEATIMNMALTIEARDANTGGHCQRMARYATALGLHLGLPDDDCAALRRGGYLHDVGKVSVPDAILLKPGALSAAEFDVMKQHTTVGDRLCGNLNVLRTVRPIVRHHHERLDGSGYPDGLSGSAIPMLAQITGIVDVFDAVTTVRPYHKPKSDDQAYEQLRSEADRGWKSAELVEEFVDMHRKLKADARAGQR